jgi:hypothetical protein
MSVPLLFLLGSYFYSGVASDDRGRRYSGQIGHTTGSQDGLFGMTAACSTTIEFVLPLWVAFSSRIRKISQVVSRICSETVAIADSDLLQPSKRRPDFLYRSQSVIACTTHRSRGLAALKSARSVMPITLECWAFRSHTVIAGNTTSPQTSQHLEFNPSSGAVSGPLGL